MANDFGMPKPPGNADTLGTVVGNLRKIAGDMDKHGGAIGKEVAPMRKAWKSGGGSAAADEATTLSGIVKNYGGHINAGATALHTYAGKLSTLQTNAAKWQGQAQTDDTNALKIARKKHKNMSDADLRKTAEYTNSSDYEDIKALQKKYHTDKSDLDTAATTCQTALHNAIPGYKKGMSPAQMMATTLNNVLLKLPSAAAEQARQDAQVFQYQLKHGIKGKDAYSLAMYQRMAAESKNPAYADAFANYLKADGIVSVPEAILQASEHGDLTDGQAKDLMTTMSNLVGTATNTTNNPNHLADGEIKKLVGYTSDTDIVDPGADGGMWRRSWAMTELLGYSNNWSPKFLSDVSNEIYENRGKLKELEQLPDERPISSADNGYIHTDPMLTALQKLDNNSQAGQLFFSKNGSQGEDKILTLMREYSQKNHTEEGILTTAIEKAAIDRTSPYHKEAADIASRFLKYAAAEGRGEDGFTDVLWKETQHAVTGVLGAYYDDVHHRLIVEDADGPLHDSSSPYNYKNLSDMSISYGDLKDLIGDVYTNADSRQTLFNAAAVYNEAVLAHDGKATPGSSAATADIGNYGNDVGKIMEIGNKIVTDNAEQSKATMQAVLAFADMAGTVAGPESELGEKALDVSLKAAETGAEFGDPTERASKLVEQVGDDVDQQNRALVVQMVVRNNLWDDKDYGADDPRKLGYWDAKTQTLQAPPGKESEFRVWLETRAERDPTVQQAMNSVVRRENHG